MSSVKLYQRLINLYSIMSYFFFSTRALGKTELIESDTTPSIITVTSADESEVDISEAVEKVTGTNWGITP